MIFGMTQETFTLAHVIISVVGILSGALMLAGMIGGGRLGGWAILFLVSTIATSVTGFMFPFNGFGRSQVVGAMSLSLLAVALIALAAHHVLRLGGVWPAVYAVAAVAALYLNVFVGVVQAFRKLPLLDAMAPTQTELPFVAVQALVLVAFIVLGFAAVRRFDPE